MFMNKRIRIGEFFTILCTSFTVITLSYILLSDFMDAVVNTEAILKLFGTCAMVALVIFITDYIPITNLPLRLLINFLDVFLTVFLFGGGILRMFPFEWEIMLIVFGMLSAAYVGVITVMVINEQIKATDINSKISEMKKENHKEDQ